MSLAEAMLAGPRGRRLLLEYALASERLTDRDDRDDAFHSAEFFASHALEPDKGSSAVLAGPDSKDAELRVVSPDEAATRLDRVRLVDATPELLLRCLARTVDSARYWQEPDGSDVLAGTAAMREALHRVSDHVATAAAAGWWTAPLESHAQWSARWDDAPPCRVPVDPQAALAAARGAAEEAERAAARERPSDPAARWGGEWWSAPAWTVPSSARELFDGSPAALWLVEDGLGGEAATCTRLGVPAGLRVYEIDAPKAWADLCRRFPFEQTAQKRHDWFRTTGRAGRWVVPDWARAAEHYDAVHLQVGAYLEAAGTAIPVDTETATVIAGWNPDETYWFSPRVRYVDDSVPWILRSRGTDDVWVRDSREG